MAGDPAADRQALVEVINLGLLWHCLCAITRLEVPERLAAGPLPVAELAVAVGAGCCATTIPRRCRPPSPPSGTPTSPMG
jgi:hypothetical protein